MLNASIRYTLMSDFDEGVFHVDHLSGKIYLDKEIDADSLPSNIYLLRVSTRYANSFFAYRDDGPTSEAARR